jgi:hypothetical protein
LGAGPGYGSSALEPAGTLRLAELPYPGRAPRTTCTEEILILPTAQLAVDVH